MFLTIFADRHFMHELNGGDAEFCGADAFAISGIRTDEELLPEEQ